MQVNSGHSSHVMNVKWSAGDECLISCGGNDKCLMQWRHSIVDASGHSSGGSLEPEPGGAFDFAAALGGGGAHRGGSHADAHGVGGLAGDDDDGPTAGDESGAVKPW